MFLILDYIALFFGNYWIILVIFYIFYGFNYLSILYYIFYLFDISGICGNLSFLLILQGLNNTKPGNRSNIKTQISPIEIFANIHTNIHFEDRSQELIEALKSFGITGYIKQVCSGPVVTLYKFKPDDGLRINSIISLANDVARILSVQSVRISRIIASDTIGIEVSKKDRAIVYIRQVLKELDETKSNILPLVLGQDIAGKTFIVDLAKMPHLLVAGTTGSGKSIAIHSMLISLLYSKTNIKLLLIDPKMIEFSLYATIPHLLYPVIINAEIAISALKWSVQEMERRYKELMNTNCRDIISYNKCVKKKLEYIVIVIDEFADLMCCNGKSEVEVAVQRLAQKGRACGIHLILATQRPCAKVITGVIKTNLPSRISLKLGSVRDSHIILDCRGAEQLLGYGDMLYKDTSSQEYRVHSSFVSSQEIEKFVKYLETFGKPEYIALATENTSVQDDECPTNDQDPLFDEAVELVIKYNRPSANFLLTKLKIGSNRASRIIQQMEDSGIISGHTHDKKRIILHKK